MQDMKGQELDVGDMVVISKLDLDDLRALCELSGDIQVPTYPVMVMSISPAIDDAGFPDCIAVHGFDMMLRPHEVRKVQ